MTMRPNGDASEGWSREDLPEQFILCRDRRHIPDRWPVRTLRGWHLGHHPSLPIIPLAAEGGDSNGWLMGYAVNRDGVFLGAGSSAAAAPGQSVVDADLETWIYGHGGRFVVVVISDAYARVYLDPFGALSTVYCPALEIVASTVSVVPPDGDTAELGELARMTRIPRSNAMYPLGLTPRKNIWRLLPNHYLDLRRWECVRHWPRSDLAPSDARSLVKQIADKVRAQTGALVSSVPVVLRLTAGYDSRMLLACARPWADSVTLLTVNRPEARSWLDCSTARRIARDFGVGHTQITYRRPKRYDLEEWVFRTGRSVGEYRGWRACTTYKQLPPRHADLLALGGAALVAYWKPQDHAETRVEPDRLLAICNAGEHPLFRQAIRSWLDALPVSGPFLTLDLFYIEQRLGCWGGVYPYAYGRDGRFQFFPFCHRDVLEATLRLPPEVRREKLLAKRVIEEAWPELLAYPFNQPRRLQRVGFAWYGVREVPVTTAARVSRAVARSIATMRRVVGGASRTSAA